MRDVPAAAAFPSVIDRYFWHGARVGERVLLGCHGGAFVRLYRVAAVDGDHARLVHVIERSVKNTDGTYSSVYEDAV